MWKTFSIFGICDLEFCWNVEWWQETEVKQINGLGKEVFGVTLTHDPRVSVYKTPLSVRSTVTLGVHHKKKKKLKTQNH